MRRTELEATAKRFAKMDSDTLFQTFYNALGKTSPRFATLHAEITAMAEALLPKKGKK